jgi:hypothetical protein
LQTRWSPASDLRVGRNGKSGRDGKRGKRGKDGKDGKDEGLFWGEKRPNPAGPSRTPV